MAIITGDNSDNSLFGTNGDDLIIGLDGDDWIYGGDGNDTLVGGNGKDDFWDTYGINVFDGGDGADSFTLSVRGTVTGGQGRDTFRLIWANPNSETNLIITDFTTGSGGDVLDFEELLYYFSHRGYTGGNPFDPALGYLRLLSSGNDTLLQWNPYGSTSGSNWQTLALLQNVPISAIIASNIKGNISPDGSGMGIVWSGTANSDVRKGTIFDDQLQGLDGNDYLYGRYGNDVIQGGDGNDILDGEIGNDTLQGGAGNDELHDFTGTNVFDGGDGDDRLYLRGPYWNGTQTATGGTGSDTYFFEFSHDKNENYVTITDFASGSGGDILNIDDLLLHSARYTGGNPFDPTLGYLRLLSSGSDTLLQWDHNGANSSDWQTLAVLQNVPVSSITADNISDNIPPDGSAGAGMIWNGTAHRDIQTGTIFDDQLQGFAGKDYLDGGYGNDTLQGGAGNDRLYGSIGNDLLQGDVGDNRLVGGSGNDTLQGGNDNDKLYGTNGNDLLQGKEGDDLLSGGGGDDTLIGGSGNDQLDGGGGKDIFIFSSEIDGAIDKIKSFKPLDDTIQLENKIFVVLIETGNLSNENFVIGDKAIDSNDFLIYNGSTGNLFYDADGNSAEPAVQIATLGVGLPLTNVNFVVI